MDIEEHHREDPANNEELQKLLRDVGRVTLAQREKNIFSLGGRGYYENPMSDLLAFFLYPTEDHDLGELALSSLAELLPEPGPYPLDLEEPPIPQYQTPAGNKIDLVLNGSGWVIALENKVTHAPVNPFADYQAAVNGDARFNGKRKYYVILSPSETNVEGWTWVNTRHWARSARERLGMQFVESGLSKWAVFLREFLMLIEDQMGVTMDDQQFRFARQNYPLMVKAVELQQQYLQALVEKARQAASEALGREPAWAAVYNWGQHGRAVRVSPAQDRGHNAVLLVCPDGSLRVQFYVQAAMRRPEANRPDFTAGGNFVDWGDENAGRTWVFGNNQDQTDLEPALQRLKEALEILRDRTQ